MNVKQLVNQFPYLFQIGGGGGSNAELEEEKAKREKLENTLKTVKAELEEAKKSSGSNSIITIKMQAMEKELAKTRKQLETAAAGPQQVAIVV